MNSVFLLLALFSEVAAATSLKFSQGFSKRLPALATVAFAVLSLTLLSFALNVKGFAMHVIYAAWSNVASLSSPSLNSSGNSGSSGTAGTSDPSALWLASESGWGLSAA